MLLDLMDDLPLLPEDAADITTTFLKCTRWEVEETTDLINCRYHYFCDSHYLGDYPSIVDLFVILITLVSFLSAAMFTIMKFTNCPVVGNINSRRRYLVPSGPLALPLILLILSRGQRINTIFPLQSMGPALLQLVYVSAISFESKSAVFDASTVSGILHSSLYVDFIILPYYTGLEALSESRFSGECKSCVCREEALVVGGKQILYRGWSKTTLSVASVLCARMLFRIFGEGQSSILIKMVFEGMSWLLIASDSLYLMIFLPHYIVLTTAAYGGLCVLILLNVLIKLYGLLGRFPKCDQIRKTDIYYDSV